MKQAGMRRSIRQSVGVLVLALSATVALAVSARAESPVATPMPGDPFLMKGSFELAPLGYALEEFTLAGNARSYAAKGATGSDGRWQVRKAASAPYRSRIVVIKPTDPAKFNGTVLVEWMNVSGGLDVPVEWSMMHREMVRSGYAYVGVSAQVVGVEGGPNLGRGTSAALKKVNPQRYGGLSHPGDAFAFDIFSDVGRLLRGRQRSAVLGTQVPQRIIAMGESQSAFFLTTYVNAVDRMARVYDGYLIHSRSGVAAPLDGVFMTAGPEVMQKPVRLRSDLRVPVMQVHTETDLLGLVGSIGFHAARQSDNARLRTWEIAGAAHADNYLFKVGMIDSGQIPVEKLAAAWAPMASMPGATLNRPMNNGPQHHYVTQAALGHLNKWVRTGLAPPGFSPLEMKSGGTPSFSGDALGITQGGVRTPWVDVPIALLSGQAFSTTPQLVGSTTLFDQDTLDRLYPGGRSDYLAKFTASLDRAIASGIILTADRDEILALARLGYHGTK